MKGFVALADWRAYGSVAMIEEYRLLRNDLFSFLVRQPNDLRLIVRYVRTPFSREPDFGVTSVRYDWRELWVRSKDA